MTDYDLNEFFSVEQSATWPVSVRYKNMVLRPLTRRDEQEWDELRTANYLWTAPWDATNPAPEPGRRMSFARAIKAQDRRARAGTHLPWVIAWDSAWPKPVRNAMSAPIIGQVSVSNIVYGSSRSASIGYWISKFEAGQGLTPIAVAMAMDYCFAVLDLHRIEIAIRPENEASLRVVQKLGMVDEGVRRSYLHIDGEWRDHRVFTMLKDEARSGLVNKFVTN